MAEQPTMTMVFNGTYYVDAYTGNAYHDIEGTQPVKIVAESKTSKVIPKKAVKVKVAKKSLLKEIDTDGNGHITKKEVKAYAKKIK